MARTDRRWLKWVRKEAERFDRKLPWERGSRPPRAGTMTVQAPAPRQLCLGRP